MFLKDLSKISFELGNDESSADFSSALNTLLEVADHTNQMMWIGKLENCPFNLCSQGQLLMHCRVLSKKIHGSFKNRNKWPCHLILFQQAVVLCKTLDNTEHGPYSDLEYFRHVW